MYLNASLQQLALGLTAFVGGLIISKSPTGELQHYNILGYISIAVSLISLALAWRVKAVQMTQTDKI